MATLKRIWEAWARDAAWGALLYLLVMAALFFVFAQGKADFIYAGF